MNNTKMVLGSIPDADLIEEIHRRGIASQITKLTTKDTATCCICGKVFEINTRYWGNNPEPVKHSGVCCDECNTNVVIPTRMKRYYE